MSAGKRDNLELAGVRALSVPPSKQWAEKLRDRELRGEQLSAIQMEFWRVALERRPVRERIPGEDDDL